MEAKLRPRRTAPFLNLGRNGVSSGAIKRILAAEWLKNYNERRPSLWDIRIFRMSLSLYLLTLLALRANFPGTRGRQAQAGRSSCGEGAR